MGGKARLLGLKRGQKETQELADEAALSWKGGRIHSSLTCQDAPEYLEHLVGLAAM